jgi:16S rRNA (guanine527-N7)-methyltransferase
MPRSVFHVKHEGWDSRDRAHGITERQGSLLRLYEELLGTVALPRGMVAASDAPRLWSRHIVDGLRGAPLVSSRAGLAYDLGSGAGLPGIPIAVARPELTVVLAEHRRSRSAFLELVVRELALPNVQVHVGRAEDLSPGADACFARAFRRPRECWRIAEPLLAQHGALLYWAGSRSEIYVEGPSIEAFFTPELADVGPIVMMTRQ